MKVFCLIVAVVAPSLAACQLPTNVAIKRVDIIRTEQQTCLQDNVAQFDDRASDAAQVGRFVAMSCSVQTQKLVQYAVPNATRGEYDAFDRDAVIRATALVQARRQS